MVPSLIEFNLLAQRVEYLTDSFHWVVGGIGIVVAVAIGIIGYAQWRVSRNQIDTLKQDLLQEMTESYNAEISRIQKDIDDRMRNVHSLVEQSIQETKEHLEKSVDDKLSVMESSLNHFRNSVEGDIARSYAFSTESDNSFAIAFNWWITAAVCYSEIRSNEMRNVAVKASRRNLDKIKEGDTFNIERLLEDMTDNTTQLNKLSQKHKEEAELLKSLMLEKAQLSKTISEESNQLSKDEI